VLDWAVKRSRRQSRREGLIHLSPLHTGTAALCISQAHPHLNCSTYDLPNLEAAACAYLQNNSADVEVGVLLLDDSDDCADVLCTFSRIRLCSRAAEHKSALGSLLWTTVLVALCGFKAGNDIREGRQQGRHQCVYLTAPDVMFRCSKSLHHRWAAGGQPGFLCGPLSARRRHHARHDLARLGPCEETAVDSEGALCLLLRTWLGMPPSWRRGASVHYMPSCACHGRCKITQRFTALQAYEVLPQGGALIAIDMLLDDERRTAEEGLARSLTMLLEFGHENAGEYTFKASFLLRPADRHHQSAPIPTQSRGLQCNTSLQ
jgi:hypothetical protein